MKNRIGQFTIFNSQFTIHNSQLISNSSAPHGMKTKIFKNLTKNYTGICTGSSLLLDF